MASPRVVSAIALALDLHTITLNWVKQSHTSWKNFVTLLCETSYLLEGRTGNTKLVQTAITRNPFISTLSLPLLLNQPNKDFKRVIKWHHSVNSFNNQNESTRDDLKIVNLLHNLKPSKSLQYMSFFIHNKSLHESQNRPSCASLSI